IAFSCFRESLFSYLIGSQRQVTPKGVVFTSFFKLPDTVPGGDVSPATQVWIPPPTSLPGTPSVDEEPFVSDRLFTPPLGSADALVGDDAAGAVFAAAVV